MIKTKLPIPPLTAEEIAEMNYEYLEQVVSSNSDALYVI